MEERTLLCLPAKTPYLQEGLAPETCGYLQTEHRALEMGYCSGRDVGVGKPTWRSRVGVHIQGCLCPPEGTWQFLKTFLGVAAYGRGVLLASSRRRPGMLLKRLEPPRKGLRSLALK